MHLFDEMYEGKIKGLFAVGTDPAVSSPNTTKVRKALEKLDWLVGENIFDNETYCFWKGPGVDPAEGQDGGLPPSRLGLHGEGGQPEQQRPLGPVEVQGRRGPRTTRSPSGRSRSRSWMPSRPSMPRRAASSRSPS